MFLTLSLLEIIADELALLSSGSVNTSFLRVLRMLLLRMLRLMRSWKGLYDWRTFGNAMVQISSLLILMGIVAVICALIGMQSFGGVYNEEAGFSSAPCPGGVCRMMTSRSSRTYHF